jgi:excisionase family DNA binding protein
MTSRTPGQHPDKRPLALSPSSCDSAPATSLPAALSVAGPAGVSPIADRQLVLSIPEACQALGIGETTLRQLIGRGQLPVLRLGRRVLIPRSGIEAMVAEAASAQRGVASPTGRLLP